MAIAGKGIGAQHDAICQVPPKSGESPFARGIGHVAGIAGLVASALVVAGLLVARHRPARCGR